MNYKDEIKAIAFDYDGTLIDFNYHVSSYTKLALEKLKNSKYKICLSSGRPCYLAKKAFYDNFGEYPLDYIFGCNGAEYEDCKNHIVNYLYPIDSKDVQILSHILNNELFYVCVYEDDKFLINRPIDDPDLMEWLKARWVTPIVYDFSKNDVPRTKVLLLNNPKNRDKEVLFVNGLKDKLSRFNCAFSSPYCFEIVQKGISKAKSVDLLCQLLNCEPYQVLTFGDMSNDMEMLKCSTGVIMDNASDELKKQIKLHTSSVDKMGVYDFLHNNGLI